MELEFLAVSKTDCSRQNKINKQCRSIQVVAWVMMILCLVPLALCDPDWSSHLTFDQIFNDTSYAQLPKYKARPIHTIQNHSHLSQNQRNVEQKYRGTGNELEYGEYDYKIRTSQRFKDSKVPLLIGFSHDPFRYSVPEDDYLKGVRDMSPKSIMSKGENRGKRGVLHLYNMMYCATGCDPLIYKGYGCYCGFLGEGRPTDGIDNCCRLHDECYENIHCPFYTVYFQPYYWKCYRGEPLCALENSLTRHQLINGCAARLCDCDRRFAMCVKKYSCPKRRALCHSSPLRLLQNLLMFR